VLEAGSSEGAEIAAARLEALQAGEQIQQKVLAEILLLVAGNAVLAERWVASALVVEIRTT
jgi:hypothetical protein